MTGNNKNAIELELKAARRTQTVGPALHDSVMRAVSAAQREELAQQRAGRQQRWWPALGTPFLGSAALASLVVAVWVGVPKERAAPLPPDPAAQALTELLEERLAQPLETLQGLQQLAPLEAELAALEADLKKMRPRWPWQPESPPAG